MWRLEQSVYRTWRRGRRRWQDVTATTAETFTPSTLTVHAGDAVSFDFQSLAHNVFFDAQSGVPADIPGTNANVSIQRTFATAGTYHYTCHIHPQMHGTIVVQ